MVRTIASRSDTERRLIVKGAFVLAAFASFLLSVSLYFIADDTSAGIFVGIWVPSILSLGGLILSRDGGAR